VLVVVMVQLSKEQLKRNWQVGGAF